MTEARTSVFEFVVARAVKRHGMLKGGRVGGRQAAFVSEWAVYAHETGDNPGNAHAFAAWANVGERTAYNRLDEFRELFPEYDTPSLIPLVYPVKGVRGLPGTAARDAVPA